MPARKKPAEQVSPRFELTEVPRKRLSNGKEGGPLLIPPGQKRSWGDKKCETCGRMVEPQSRAIRKGKCKCFYYKRTTTWIDVLQDEYLLKQWGNRNVAWGVAQRPDLVLAAAACKPDSDDEQPAEDKSELNRIAKEAQDFAGSKVKASIGTSLHKLTHQLDRGETLGYVPDRWVEDIKAYEAWKKEAGVEWVAVEAFRSFDDWMSKTCKHYHPLNKLYEKEPCHCVGVAGTVDRIGWFRGRLTIFDIKGLALNTAIPTPSGWTTMGAVQVGDQVLGADGKPCNVIRKSDTKRIGTFTVSFNDGSQVVCDSEHIWWTTNKDDRNNRREPQARNILDIIATLKRSGTPQHAVPLTKPLNLPDAELPVDPYLLGVWLGDGTTKDGSITKGRDLFKILTADGWQLGEARTVTTNCEQHTVIGLRNQLRKANLLGNKHVPDVYLRASHEQRLRLLQGLMDTDGTCGSDGRAAFYSSNKALAYAVHELLCTLGQRPYLGSSAPTGRTRQTNYHVRFMPVDIQPFRLPRKAIKVTQPKIPGRAQRIITSVDPGPDVETACIGVDSSNNVYLCSEAMIPTHNTGSTFNKLGHAMQLAMYARMKPYIIATDERGQDVSDVDLNIGYIIALPEGKGQCTLEPLDIAKGWGACTVAKKVWQAREQDYGIPENSQLLRDGGTFKDLAARASSRRELKLIAQNAKESCALTSDLKEFLNRRWTEVV